MTFSEWVTCIASIITIVSAIVSVIMFFYKKARDSNTLFYYGTSDTIIHLSEAYEDLEINYRNTPISSLEKTTVYLWASRDCEILKGDYLSNMPPRIFIDTDDISDVILDFKTESLCKPDFSKPELSQKSDKVIECNFERISYNNGFAVTIIHTANTENLVFESNLIDKYKSVLKSVYSPKTIAMAWVYAIFAGLSFLLFAVNFSNSIPLVNWEGIILNGVFAIIDVILLIFCVWVIRKNSRFDLPKNIADHLSRF